MNDIKQKEQKILNQNNDIKNENQNENISSTESNNEIEKENLEKQNININQDFNRFEKLKILQSLIKKESAMKELCKNIYLYNLFYSFKNKR
jgi:hypothetical protein